MAGLANARPVCQGDKEQGEYDLPLHVAALFLVMGASILGAGFPVLSKRVKWLRVPPKIFFACKHFGTGVLIATAFVHLLPTTFLSLTDPCLPEFFTDIYPALPGVIMMASMFCLFVVEMYLNSKTGGHSHGGPTGTDIIPRPNVQDLPQSPARPQRPQRRRSNASFEAAGIDEEKMMAHRMYAERVQSVHDRHHSRLPSDVTLAPPFEDPDLDMPPWFEVFYEQYVRQRMEMLDMIGIGGGGRRRSSRRFSMYPVESPDPQPTPPTPRRLEQGDAPEGWFPDNEGNWTDPLVYRKMSLNITLLEGGILFHSVFVGITVSLTVSGFVILLVAILFHQMFEGLGLGSRIAAVPYPKGSVRPWLLVFAFGATAPLGQAIGLAARGSYDPDSAFGLIIVGVFNAISSGLLIYAALVDLLAEDFLSEEANAVLKKKDKIMAFCYVLLGAVGMSIVGAFA